MIKEDLRNLIDQVLSQLKEEKYIPRDIAIPKYAIEIPPTNISANLASNVALLLSKVMSKPAKEIGEKIKEEIIREQLPEYLPPDSSPLIGKVEVSPSGFLNFTIVWEKFYQELKKIIAEKGNYGKINLGKGEKVLFEFVSANPTGPLHIGHGRGAAVGDSLARIFEFLGWQVTREYYLNDIGNQIDNLAGSVMLKCEELKNGYLTDDEKEWLSQRDKQNFYRGEYITQIAKDTIKEFPRVNLGENGHKFFAKQVIQEILTWIKNDLKDFNVKFDTWVYESSLYEKKEVEQTLTTLRIKGLAYEKDNALWFKSTVYGDEKDRVLIRADGRPTYLAGDIAYHRNKLERKFGRLINVWGADHHGYIPRTKAAIKALGYSPEDLQVVLCQLVKLKKMDIMAATPTMSTRSGEFVPLRELLKEIGKDASRFFFLTRSPEAQLEFDLELAKKQSPENPVYYIQYAYTRVAGIFREARKAGFREEAIGTRENLQLLKEKAELDLIKKLSFFPDTLLTCMEDLSPHHLTTYLLDLANDFHRYYEKYRVISENKDLTLTRLVLVEAIGIIIRNGLNLIGVSAPEKM